MKGFLLHSRDRVIEAFMWQNFNQIQILPTKKRRFRGKPPEEDHREKSELFKREQRVRERVFYYDDDDDGALVAMELNTALHAMNSIIGRVGVEDLLDEIFASFCLGK